VSWESMMVGKGWCSVFVGIAAYILRHLGIDAYSVGVDIWGAHAVLGIHESDIKRGWRSGVIEIRSL